MKRLLALALLLIVADSRAAHSFTETIDDYLQRMSEFGFSGAILIAQNDRILLEKGYGFADREKNEKIHIQTPFFVASITKPFTAAAILHLQTKGKIDIKKPITAYLQNVPSDKEAITIESLLIHASGLPEDCIPNFQKDVKTKDAIQNILDLPLDSKPGEKFRYSNAGYSLLAAMVEIISGMKYEQYVTAHLLKPAGMNQSAFLGESNRNWDQHPPAHTYNVDDDYGSSGSWEANWGLRGGTGLITTVGDLHRWNQALLNGTILPRELVDASFLPRIAAREKMKYGYGWWIILGDDGSMIRYHGGGHYPQGATAEFRYYTKTGLTTIVAVNSMIDDIGGSRLIRDCISASIFGGDCKFPPTINGEISGNEFAGTYRLSTGGSFHIENQKGKLKLNPAGQDALDALLSYPDKTRESYEEIHQKIRELNGKLENLELIGTIPLDTEGMTSTYYRLKSQNGEIIQRMIFRGTNPGFTLSGPSLPGRWWLMPQGNATFRSYFPLLQQTIRIVFEGSDVIVWNPDGKKTIATHTAK